MRSPLDHAQLAGWLEVLTWRPEPFSVAVTSRGEFAYVTVVGEIDLATLDELEDASAGQPGPGTSVMVVDLSRVSFCSCGGMSWLDGMRERADRRGARLEVVIDDSVRRGLSVLGLLDKFRSTPTGLPR